jgi:hypothetical protein
LASGEAVEGLERGEQDQSEAWAAPRYRLPPSKGAGGVRLGRAAQEERESAAPAVRVRDAGAVPRETGLDRRRSPPLGATLPLGWGSPVLPGSGG